MWQYLGYTALDVANQRTREAQDNADRWRLLHATDAERGQAGRPARRWPARGSRRAAAIQRRVALGGRGGLRGRGTTRAPDGVTSLHQASVEAR